MAAEPATAPASQPTREAQELWQLTRILHEAQVQAITSVQGKYVYKFLQPFKMEVLTSQCEFAVSGPWLLSKVYHRQAFVGPNGQTSELREVAWDGGTLWQRSRDGLLLMSKDATARRASSPLPHSVLDTYRLHQLQNGLGGWRLISADRNGDVVRSLHESDEAGARLTLWSDLEKGGWPTRIEVVGLGPGPQNTFVTDSISYVERDDHGNRLYYPVSARVEARAGDSATMLEEFTAEPDSIQINQPIPNERFRLEPTPDEALYNQDTGLVIREAANKRPAGAAPPNPTTTLAGAQPGQAQWVMPPPPPDRIRWALPAAGAGIAIIGAGVWLIRRRRTHRA
jgi:hypothetical protein